MNPEISTRAERAATVEPEPSLTVSQFASLLHAAAEVERARRPIVLHGPEVLSSQHLPETQPANVVRPTGLSGFHSPQHPGIDVRYPSAAEAAYVAPWAPLRHPVSVRAWGATLAYAGIGVLLTGAGDGVVAGDSTLSVGACIGGLAAIVIGLIRAQFEDGAR